MLRLSVVEMIENIENEKPFHAVAIDYSFTIKIEKYVHYACTAIHNGHQLRKELWENCSHTEYERWYEEDPETKTFIKSLPIVIDGRDSRFEYDLNRSPSEAVFETAWGKKLWIHPLSKEQKETSLKKHDNFYKVIKALIKKLEQKFGVCIVYDMHSYNWKRWDRDVPTWNLGTSNIDNDRFGNCVEAWRIDLSKIDLPYHIKSEAKINDTFQGNGYLLKFITKHFNHTLVLATEISKIYCDELSQLIYPEVIKTVEHQLKPLLIAHANQFYKTYSKK